MAATGDQFGNLAEVINLLWNPPNTPKRGPRPGLNLTEIASAAIAIADADGLAAVTMQHLAEALGVTKMALYRYVPGKTELVALMTDVGLGEPKPLDARYGWREQLKAWAQDMFDRFAHHPWALESTVGLRAMGPNEADWVETALAALTGTSLTGSEKLDVAATLSGHARAIAQQSAAGIGTDPEHALESAFAAFLVGRERQFPALAEALRSSAETGGQNQALQFGLDRILDGVELLIAKRLAEPSAGHAKRLAE